MDRGWYVRFTLTFALIVGAVAVVWPSVDAWLPAPAWLKDKISSRIAPGLDVKGGLRLTYEVEVDEAVSDRRDRLADDLLDRLGAEFGLYKVDERPTKEQLDQAREKVKIQTVGERQIRLSFQSAADAKKLTLEMIRKFGDLKEESRADSVVTVGIRPDMVDDLRDSAVGQARETIADRIDKLGVRETSVTARGTDIAVEIPGADEASFQRIREIIGRTARLEFKIVDDDSDYVQSLTNLPEGIERQSEVVSAGVQNPQKVVQYLTARGEDARQKLQAYVDSLKGKTPEGRDLLLGEQEDYDVPGAPKASAWRTYILYHRADVGGEDVKDAFTAFDQENNRPFVSLAFNPKGSEKFGQLTGRNIKRRMAIVLDDRVESAPVIQTEIRGNCQITLGGSTNYNETLREARDLSLVLRAGALPAPIRPANEQLIGPSLGQDAIEKSAIGAVLGVALIVVFMLLYYQMAGIVADFAVLLNLLFLLALMSLFEATLTLPGVAGIALTVGMAVDANVLINERIREELRAGKSARTAVDQGFDRAFWSIFDGQLTTFISGVVLFQYGTGPIKGFAVTLMIGITTSLFTGVFCSRLVFDWLVRGLRVKTLKVG
ncbi:MAG TPA: protein translocase subunit SecD [Polyangiales bacterium]|nr:protein translocase subunit SecD [Polyangiales bacterium]